MDMTRLFPFVVVAVAIVGCQIRLKFDTKVEISQGKVHTSYVDGPNYDQKVVVGFESSAAPVHVVVVLEKDEAAGIAAIDAGKVGPGVLNAMFKSMNGEMTVEILAKAKFAVLVGGADAKATTVSLRIAGK
jgi:hypothetical protein